MTNSDRTNLIGLDRAQMEAFFLDMGEKRFRASQILKWVHQHGATRFDDMTDLSKALRARLTETAVIEPPTVVTEQASSDGTHKWLIRIDAANCVEMVFIPEDNRGTLCISSQVGCALNCTFCATAQQGFNRNLTAAEIIGQLWHATHSFDLGHARQRVITNVVMMGMGEPLLNFDNVVTAMGLMQDDHAYGLARRRVTLSTAGVVPALDRLRERCPVSLAVSLHAPDDALRDDLVPINRSYPIRELLDACRRYVAAEPKDKITFEYVMLDSVNDTPAHARALARLLSTVPAKVNLIPFNPFPATRYRRSPRAVIDRFRDILVQHGIVTITRKTRGDDIGAACGQLAGRVQPRSRRVARRRGMEVRMTELGSQVTDAGAIQ